MSQLVVEKRAGGIVYRKTDHGPEYLMVTSNSYSSRWVIPAGHVEAGEEFIETALREVKEEAGVLAHPLILLGNYRYYWYREGNRKVLIETHLFLMEYLKTIELNPEGRRVEFFDYQKIQTLSVWPESREYLVKAHQFTSNNINEES